ncbi:MAG: hypothetical protein IKC48_02655 [Clostridia bacterium]|nr:hypothetical protein [Clostridia bacterium]
MKKVIPIVTIILSIVALAVAGLGLLFSCNVLINPSGLGDAFLILFAIAFTIPALIVSAINTCVSFIFVKSKACLVAGIISAVALIMSAVALILLRVDGYSLIQ